MTPDFEGIDGTLSVTSFAMALPSILNVRRRKNVEGRPSTQSEAKGVQEELRHVNATKPEIRKATKVRRIVIAVAAFAFVMSVIFNLLVCIPNHGADSNYTLGH